VTSEWDKNEAKAKTANVKLGKEIVAVLGEGAVDESHTASTGITITLTDEGKGYFIETRDRTHYKVTGQWPGGQYNDRFYPDSDDRISIRVARSRGVKTLVSEINRRLAPTYDKQFVEQVERMHRAHADRARQVKAIKEIAEMIGLSLTPNEERSGRLRHHQHNLQEINICASGETASITTYPMPIKTAKMVLALIVKRNAADA